MDRFLRVCNRFISFDLFFYFFRKNLFSPATTKELNHRSQEQFLKEKNI